MISYTGKSVCPGIALGTIKVLPKSEQKIVKKHVEDVENEINRFFGAHKETLEQLKKIADKALKEFGENNARIFNAHYMLLTDTTYIETITGMIRNNKVNAEYAIKQACEKFMKTFMDMDNEYMKERAEDVKDVSTRLLMTLSNTKGKLSVPLYPVIIAADDLTPSEILQLNKKNILALVMKNGSSNSHAAILAKAMDIPMLFYVNYDDDDIDNKFGIVNSMEAVFYVEPDNALIEEMENRQKEAQKNKELLLSLKEKENITLDGRQIDLFANIAGIDDVRTALYYGAGGIGLLRSEFLYLGKNTFPTEEELFMEYKNVAETMLNKKVVIRTLDIGADKNINYLKMEEESNPALGYRAIRICLDNPDLFKTQLRAILRAGKYGNIAIMYPMIISLSEIKEIKNLMQQVKDELKKQNISYGEVSQGIMIETPAAVMISEELAEEVDFFSIGTNDLTQYTLALDRQNSKLERFYDSHHPAVIRMIEMAVRNGHKHGRRVAICGELAADETLTETFIKMGIDELSVPPSMILQVRKKIREIRITE